MGKIAVDQKDARTAITEDKVVYTACIGSIPNLSTKIMNIYTIARLLHRDFRKTRKQVKLAVDNSPKSVSFEQAMLQVKKTLKN